MIASIAFLSSCGKKETEKKGMSEVADTTKATDGLITYDDSLDFVYRNEFNPNYKECIYNLTKGHSVRFCTKNNNKSQAPFLFMVLTSDTIIYRVPVRYNKCKCYVQPADPDRNQRLRIVYHFKKKKGAWFWTDVASIKRDSTKHPCECDKNVNRIKDGILKNSITATAGGAAGTVTTSVEEK